MNQTITIPLTLEVTIRVGGETLTDASVGRFTWGDDKASLLKLAKDALPQTHEPSKRPYTWSAPWTPEERTTLLKMRAEGKKGVEIAAVLGKTTGSVWGQIELMKQRGEIPRGKQKPVAVDFPAESDDAKT